MPISHQHKCIFVHIPKCAGTSIESVLGMHGDIKTIGIEPYLNQQINNETLFGKGAQHYTLDDIELHINPSQYNEYFKFAFVRNPWERFVSHVAWQKRKWHTKEPLNQEDVDNAIIKLKSLDKVNDHLKPQWQYIYNNQGESPLDFVGRFENLSNDWNKIANILGLEVSLPNRMSSNHVHYSQYLSDEQAEILADFYRVDREIFDYEFERK